MYAKLLDHLAAALPAGVSRRGEELVWMAALAITTALLATVLVFAISVAHAVGPEERWVVLAARQEQGEATDLALSYARSVDGVRVVRAKNGWFAIIVGPTFTKTMAEARTILAPRLFIPSDAYLGRMEGFSEVVFEAPSSPIKAVGEYRGGPATVTRYKSLTVVLNSVRSNDGSNVPTVEIRPDGMKPFRAAVSTQSIDTFTFSKARIVQLDPTTSAPQVILTYYTGGAHCCTVTKIASQDNSGSWSITNALTLDADGYEFEDADADGSVELITVDNSFFYTFESYAGSVAPMRLYRFASGVLREVTNEPGLRPFLQRGLRWLERLAASDTSRWSNNGFLAGWVASKAQLGEVDVAWPRMLATYDHNPMFGPEACAISAPLEKCPTDKLRRLPFPEALRAHLVAGGYSVPVYQTPGPAPRGVEPSRPLETTSGTAFFITGDGHLLTNAHVVRECKSITVTRAAEEPLPAKLVALDAINDLAVVSTASKPEAVASFRSGIRVGEAVAVYGFPLAGLLSSGGNFTFGNVTALAGLRDDSRLLQISAPVQAGNSGGPLLDETGAVVGIVVSKLNAMLVAIATDDLAQNINFAIKASTARAFAEAHGINIDAAAPNGAILRPADLADKARAISAHIVCTR